MNQITKASFLSLNIQALYCSFADLNYNFIIINLIKYKLQWKK